MEGMGGTGPINGRLENGVTPTHLQQRGVFGVQQQHQMSYNGGPPGSGLGGAPAFQKQTSFNEGDGQKLTAYQRRQLERQRTEGNDVGASGALSIEERLARLKQIHQKPTRPPSAQRRQVARGSTGM